MKSVMKLGVKVWAVVLVLSLANTATAGAVDYRNQYKSGGAVQSTGSTGSVQGQSQSAFGVQSTAPRADFQSTSAYTKKWDNGGQLILNSDGTVNEGVYTTTTQTLTNGSGPRRADAIDPTEDDEEFPIGDGLWAMMVLACAFAFGKWIARTKPLR